MAFVRKASAVRKGIATAQEFADRSGHFDGVLPGLAMAVQHSLRPVLFLPQEDLICLTPGRVTD